MCSQRCSRWTWPAERSRLHTGTWACNSFFGNGVSEVPIGWRIERREENCPVGVGSMELIAGGGTARETDAGRRCGG
jgi:hypothetical protein